MDPENRLARLSVQHENKAHLRQLDHGVALGAAVPQVDENWRRRKVVVPDVMANDLIVPPAFSSLRVQRQNAVGEQVLALAKGPVEIVSDGPGACEYPATLFVDRDASPCIATAKSLTTSRGRTHLPEESCGRSTPTRRSQH